MHDKMHDIKTGELYLVQCNAVTWSKWILQEKKKKKKKTTNTPPFRRRRRRREVVSRAAGSLLLDYCPDKFVSYRPSNPVQESLREPVFALPCHRLCTRVRYTDIPHHVEHTNTTATFVLTGWMRRHDGNRHAHHLVYRARTRNGRTGYYHLSTVVTSVLVCTYHCTCTVPLTRRAVIQYMIVEEAGAKRSIPHIFVRRA